MIDESNFEMLKSKRIKQLKLLNAMPETVKLTVRLDFSNQIIVIAEKKETHPTIQDFICAEKLKEETHKDTEKTLKSSKE